MTSHLNQAGDSVLLGTSDVEEAVAASVWPEQRRADRFGVEVEAFPLIVDHREPAGRLRLHEGHPSVVDIISEVAAEQRVLLPRLEDELTFPTNAGGRITFEPGGQIEHSTAPSGSTADVVGESAAVWGPLRDVFWSRGVCLVSLGIDLWNDVVTIPQQRAAGRYRAMDIYFAARGPSGATMMRNTCSVQVNLDAGEGDTRRERWLGANLLSPLLTAMFASSPGPGIRSLRAQVWQQLDPTRTGFPGWADGDDADPIKDTVTSALAADVMFITRGGITNPGRPDWAFADWLRDGDPTAGPPTRKDLETHLTTLFTEVRPRDGVLELRGIDGLPQRWWHVPLVVAAALLYDPISRSRLLDLLSPLASRLTAVWHRAAVVGLADPELARLAMAVADLAVDAARRDTTRFDPIDVASTEAFLEEFTLHGLSPADILLTKLTDPAAALAWAEPEHAARGAA